MTKNSKISRSAHKSKRKAKLELGNNSFARLKRGQKLDPARKILLEQYVKAGEKPSRIMRQLNLSKMAVWTWSLRIRAGEGTAPRPRSGRPVSVVSPTLLSTINETQREEAKKPNTMATFRAKVLKKTKKAVSARSFKRAMRKVAFTSKKGIKKPELMVLKCKERLKGAKERLKWNLAFVGGIVWIDEAVAMRDSVGRFIVRRGEHAPFVKTVDGKGEKVHFLIGISGKWKTPFERLALRQPVLKDKNGNTVPRTLKNGTRRKFDPQNPGKNKLLNLPNEGETWTADRVTKILTSPAWLPALKKATGVVLDAQSGFHKPVIAALKARGVNVIEHPPGSPDFNLCEQANAAVKRANTDVLTTDVLTAGNNLELAAALKKNWATYDLAKFAKHIANYPKIMRACVDNNGGPTLG